MAICTDTMIILFFVLFLISIIIVMFVRQNKDGFENEPTVMDATQLLALYNEMTSEEKQAFADEIGIPCNTDNMILKSSIPPQPECPSIDMNEYVKISSIPPCPEVQPCIAPRVVIDAKDLEQDNSLVNTLNNSLAVENPNDGELEIPEGLSDSVVSFLSDLVGSTSDETTA